MFYFGQDGARLLTRRVEDDHIVVFHRWCGCGCFSIDSLLLGTDLFKCCWTLERFAVLEQDMGVFSIDEGKEEPKDTVNLVAVKRARALTGQDVR